MRLPAEEGVDESVVVAVALVLLTMLLFWMSRPRWPKHKMVKEIKTDRKGTKVEKYVRYSYPQRATGWWPLLGHTLPVISSNGIKWLQGN
jgi:hypothetical protein